jgi:hypothetical protein
VRQVFIRVYRLETVLDLCSFSGVYQPWLIKGLGDWRVFNWILFGQAKLCPNSYQIRSQFDQIQTNKKLENKDAHDFGC